MIHRYVLAVSFPSRVVGMAANRSLHFLHHLPTSSESRDKEVGITATSLTSLWLS